MMKDFGQPIRFIKISIFKYQPIDMISRKKNWINRQTNQFELQQNAISPLMLYTDCIMANKCVEIMLTIYRLCMVLN